MATGREIRGAIVQAQESETGFNFYAFELLVVAIGVGVGYKSWYLGGGTFIVGIILLMIPYVRGVLAFLLSALWGVAGYALGKFFSGIPAGVTIGILAFLVTLGLHLFAIQRASDLNAPD